MTEAWAELLGKVRWTLRLPLPGSVFEAFRQGRATSPDRVAGTVGWEEWLTGEATRSPRPRPDRSAGTSPTPSRA